MLLSCSLLACGYADTLGAQPVPSRVVASATEQFRDLPEATLVETWTFKGFEADKYKELRLNLSDIVGTDHVLVIGADEGASIQVLKKVGQEGGPKVYKNSDDIPLENVEENGEMDIEALASDSARLFVIGSHSSKRKRVKSLQDLRADPGK